MAGFARIASIALLGLQLCGCIIIPLPTNRTAPAPVTPALPAEVKTSSGQVMILAQSYAGGLLRDDQVVVSIPQFTDAAVLDATVGQLDLKTVYQFLLIWGAGAYSGGIDIVRKTGTTLTRLCIVTPDGWQLTLAPATENEWRRHHWIKLHGNRRDAIIETLRSNSESPFTNIDGPCGVKGKTDWPLPHRAAAIQFLERIPRIDAADDFRSVAAVLARAKKSAAEAGSGAGMVLAVVNLGGKEFAPAPLYLGAADMQAFRGAMQSISIGGMLSVLLPQFSKGEHAVENSHLKNLCAISGDGGMGRLLDEGMSWTPTGDWPLGPRWQTEAQEILSGRVRVREWNDGCLPMRPAGWTDAEAQGASAFVGALPMTPSPAVSSAQAFFRNLIHSSAGVDPTRAGALLLLPTRETVHPFFLLPDQSVEVLRHINIMEPTVLAEALDLPLHAPEFSCILTVDGRMIEITRGTKDADSWQPPSLNRITPAFKNSAINAMRDGKAGYEGSYVCSLERANWTPEQRERTSVFLQRIDAAETTPSATKRK